MANRPMPRYCGVGGCANRVKGSPICAPHWRALPEDLQERLKWAVDEHDHAEVEAAIHTITDYLSEVQVHD